MSPTRYPFSQHRISSSQWPLLLHEGSQLYLTLFNPRGLQRARPPCRSPITGVYSNSSPLSQWCHPTISVISFTSCLQSCPASGSFPMSQLFTSGGQSIGASAPASVFPMNIRGWFPLGLTDFVSLQSKGLSRVFSNTKIWKYYNTSVLQHSAFFMVKLSYLYMTALFAVQQK